MEIRAFLLLFLGDRGGFGGSPWRVQGGVEPVLVELGAPSLAHAARGDDVRGDGAVAPRGAPRLCRRAQARENNVAGRSDDMRETNKGTRVREEEGGEKLVMTPTKRTPGSLSTSQPPKKSTYEAWSAGSL